MKKFLLIIAILFSGITSSYATHIMGGDITYVCLGGNVYDVTLTLYRDCGGTTLATTPQPVDFNSSCGTMTINFPWVSTTNVSQVCPTATTTCNGGTNPGTQQYIFRAQVTLTPCVDWTMSWDLCCRNTTDNLTATPSMYFQTTLNSVAAACNNSLQFFNTPAPYLCANTLNVFSHGAADPDGDSLYYEFQNPLTTPGPPGTNVPINTAAGYSLTQPVLTTATGALIFDQDIGELCFTPSQGQTVAIAMLISEYRNGVLIGTVIREMQVIVVPSCSNNVPQTGGLAPTCGGSSVLTNLWSTSGGSVVQIDNNSIIMCPGDSVCFDVNFSDPDTGPIDNILITSNLTVALPGNTFTVANNSTPNPVATVCWGPFAANTGLQTITMVATDDRCPVNSTQSFVFDIEVSAGIYAGADQTFCMGDTVKLNSSGAAAYTWYEVISPPPAVPIPVPTTGPGSFSCNPCSNPYFIPTTSPITTNYYVWNGLSVGTCKDRDTVTISVVTNPLVAPILPTDSFFCAGSPAISIDIDAGTDPSGANYASYSWFPLPSNTDTNRLAAINTAGVYTVKVSDGICSITSTPITVTSFSPQVIISGEIVICSDQTTDLSIDPIYQNPIWSTGETTSTITVPANIGNVTVTADSAGCSTSPSVTISSKPVPTTIITGIDSICPDATISLGTTGTGFTYLWSPTSSTASTTTTGSGPVSVTITQNGCSFTTNSVIYSHPNPVANFTITPENSGEPNIDIIFTDASTGASSWVWDFDVTSISSNPSTEVGQGPFNFIYDTQGSYTVTLAVTNDDGCAHSTVKEYLIFSEVGTPNVITPNGDGKNDLLIIENLDPTLFPNHITVLNRWGKKVFDQDNYNNDWDGDNLKEGTYYYILTVEYKNGEESYKGTLTILR